MAFAVKTAKTLRTHWKKSIFAGVVISYGYGYAKEYFEIQELMRVYCEKAAKYGEQPIPIDLEPRNITVILNPNANKRKSAAEFEKYCAPILHLAGISVNVIKTESEGHAKTLINDLKSTDAVVVAGGDGTLSEVVTGLLRRTQENNTGLVPIGVLPLGRMNSFAENLFSGNATKVRALADAAMAIVEEAKIPVDVLKVELLDEDSDNKPIYALSGIKWGAYRDAEFKKDSYWVYGSWRKYATYLFNGYKNSLTWNCVAELNYSPPCSGCSNCTKRPQALKGKWFDRFVRDQPNALNILNPECQSMQAKEVSTVDFNIFIPKIKNEVPRLLVNIGPRRVDYLKFVKEGWRSENGEKRAVQEIIEARSVEVRPKKVGEEAWFSIDNESYELKDIRVTLLPKFINVFCNKK